MSLLIDIDGAHGPMTTALFGLDHWRPICVRTRDHGRGDGDLRGWIERLLPELAGSLGRIQVMTTPRVLGLVFNPLSVFFCHDRQGQLRGVVFEVSNFHKGRKAYAFDVDPAVSQPLHFRCPKQFHVSPFNPPGGEYHFRLSRSESGYRLGIQLRRERQIILSAVQIASSKPLTSMTLLRSFPFNLINPALIVGAILIEAVKLWFAGLKFHAPRRDTVDTKRWRQNHDE
jgi:DUF1365 family protein